MASKAFIDSNVLANWLLLDGVITKIKDRGEAAVAELKKRSERKWPSYLLLEEIRETGRFSPLKFGTSLLALAETTTVIFNEYVASRLHEKNVPYQFWEWARKREHLSESDVKDLLTQIQRFRHLYLWSKPSPMEWLNWVDFDAVANMIAQGASTTDAFLVGAANEAGCKYFVSEDDPLRRILRKVGSIRQISAQAMLDELRKSNAGQKKLTREILVPR